MLPTSLSLLRLQKQLLQMHQQVHTEKATPILTEMARLTFWASVSLTQKIESKGQWCTYKLVWTTRTTWSSIHNLTLLITQIMVPLPRTKRWLISQVNNPQQLAKVANHCQICQLTLRQQMIETYTYQMVIIPCLLAHIKGWHMMNSHPVDLCPIYTTVFSNRRIHSRQVTHELWAIAGDDLELLALKSSVTPHDTTAV